MCKSWYRPWKQKNPKANIASAASLRLRRLTAGVLPALPRRVSLSPGTSMTVWPPPAPNTPPLFCFLLRGSRGANKGERQKSPCVTACVKVNLLASLPAQVPAGKNHGLLTWWWSWRLKGADTQTCGGRSGLQARRTHGWRSPRREAARKVWSEV